MSNMRPPTTFNTTPRYHQTFASNSSGDPSANSALRRFSAPPLGSPATATNRVPVIGRTAHSRGLNGARQHTYSKPFPVPAYLRHSAYYHRFLTTPLENGGSGVDAGMYGAKPSLSDGSGLPGADGASILLPTCWDEDDKCSLIELSTDGLGMNFAGSAKYGDRDAAAVRTNRPVPAQCGVYYYEITITDKGLSGYIGLGFSHRDVKLTRLPGWEDNSYGYHGDDGRAFCCLGTGESFGPTFTTGDVVGCGVDYTGVAPPTEKEVKSGRISNEGGKVFFTKNGELLGYAFSSVHGKLYPSVGLRTPGEMVRANFGSEPFRFDIDSLVRERARQIQASISSTVVPPTLLLPSPLPPIPSLLSPSVSPSIQFERTHETLQALIGSYLLHHGYGKTAEAFQRQVVQERRERSRGLFGPPDTAAEMELVKDASRDEERLQSLLSSSGDSSVRGAIREAYLKGSIGEVRLLMSEHYPAVLRMEDERGGVTFRLGVREFVEGVRRAGRPAEEKGKERAAQADEDDIEVTPATVPETYSTPPETPSPSLDDALLLGRSLHTHYGSSVLPYVQEQLRLAFSLLAYEVGDGDSGLEAAPNEVRRLLSDKEREKEADEINALILVSQSLPPTPHLESLYRHTAAVFSLLSESDMAERGGGGCMVDIRSVLT